MTLNDAQQEKKLAAALREAEQERKRKDAARRQRLSRARRAVGEAQDKALCAKLRDFCPDLLDTVVGHAAWIAKFCDLTPAQAAEEETKLMLEELAEIGGWEQSLALQPEPKDSE